MAHFDLVSTENKMICHLCFKKSTNSILTVCGPSLPVCIVCVPPWINNKTHKWWYEIKKGRNQERPTLDELAELEHSRKTMIQNEELYTDVFDKELYLCKKDNKYIQRFNITELLRHWNPQLNQYIF